MKNLLTKIKDRLKNSQELYVPRLSPDCRIYCIGDIHGRYDLLKQIHLTILDDAKAYLHDKSIIYIGDYVDRGSQSKQVVDYLLSNPFPSFKNIFLLGNHEQVLLEFLHDPISAGTWFNFGGLSTLLSYNVKVVGIPCLEQLNDLRLEFQEKIPETHLNFFRQLMTCYEKDDYYFVHAGVLPGVKLKNQRIEDMLWIRDKFLESNRFHDKVIVHGHSITETPIICANRIGIDTGAYNSGILTCLVLEGEYQRFLSTS